jgi:aminoglycoside 3-N-acetyltransferase
MQTVCRNEIIHCIQSLGISKGDGLMVHSAVQYLGKPVGGIGMYYDALHSVIGSEGTVVVPTFTFSFARTGRYDLKSTPSKEMGVFSEYVRLLPNAVRTKHPMSSFAAIGKLANTLVGRDTPSAYDPGSAVELMIESDFKLLLLGADIQAASIIHYCEQRANVPYRYWKDFSGQVKIGDQWLEKSYRMFVRDLKIDPDVRARPIQDEMKKKGLLKQVKLNYGWIAVCLLQDFVKVADEMLARNPWILVSNYQPGTMKASEGCPP